MCQVQVLYTLNGTVGTIVPVRMKKKEGKKSKKPKLPVELAS